MKELYLIRHVSSSSVGEPTDRGQKQPKILYQELAPRFSKESSYIAAHSGRVRTKFTLEEITKLTKQNLGISPELVEEPELEEFLARDYYKNKEEIPTVDISFLDQYQPYDVTLFSSHKWRIAFIAMEISKKYNIDLPKGYEFFHNQIMGWCIPQLQEAEALIINFEKKKMERIEPNYYGL